MPGEEDDFFREDKMKAYFQQVVRRDIEDQKAMGGTIAGLSEGGTTGMRNQEPDQDDHGPETNY